MPEHLTPPTGIMLPARPPTGTAQARDIASNPLLIGLSEDLKWRLACPSRLSHLSDVLTIDCTLDAERIKPADAEKLPGTINGYVTGGAPACGRTVFRCTPGKLLDAAAFWLLPTFAAHVVRIEVHGDVAVICIVARNASVPVCVFPIATIHDALCSALRHTTPPA